MFKKEYRERGTTGVFLSITFGDDTDGTVLMETCDGRKSIIINKDFRARSQVSEFLKESGFSDRSGIRTQKITTLINGARSKY